MCFTSHLYTFFREMSIQVLRSLFLKLFCLVTLTFKLPGISLFLFPPVPTAAAHSSPHSTCPGVHHASHCTQSNPAQLRKPHHSLHWEWHPVGFCRTQLGTSVGRGPAFTTHELNLKFKFPSYSGSPLPGTHSLCLPQVLNALTDLYIRP